MVRGPVVTHVEGVTDAGVKTRSPTRRSPTEVTIATDRKSPAQTKIHKGLSVRLAVASERSLGGHSPILAVVSVPTPSASVVVVETSGVLVVSPATSFNSLKTRADGLASGTGRPTTPPSRVNKAAVTSTKTTVTTVTTGRQD